MPADTLNETADEVKQAPGATADAIAQGQRAIKEALAAAERRLAEASKTAEKTLRDGVETLRAQTKAYRESAGPRVEEAQRYVVDKVKERPVTAALAGLGVGLLLGLLLSNRNK